MKPDERRACVEALADLRPRPHTPIDLEAASTFLPLPSTRRAFAGEASVVLGGRGTGKTAIFNVMIDPKRRGEILAALSLDLPGARWLSLYSGGRRGEPEVTVLESLGDLADLDLRAMWTALLTAAIAKQQPETPLPEPLQWLHGLAVNSPRHWIARARASFGALITALDDFEAALGPQGATLYCCYDALDRISPFDLNMRRRHLRAILALWTSLAGRLRRIRPKIFLRADLADAGELAFADASKLLSRAASLEWSHEELTRLLVRYLARDEAMRAWLSRVKGLTLQHDPRLGWLPGPMREVVRDAFTHRLVGPTVGAGIFQTASGRWILARMADARGEITPRTVLSFYGAAGAARLTRLSEHDGRSVRLLDAQDLRDALQSTSQGRVTELREDYPIVNRLLNLKRERCRLPLPRSRAIDLFAAPSDAEREQGPSDGAQVLHELVRLGAVSVHPLSAAEESVDIPDIYRVGFGIDIDYQGALGAYLADGDMHFLQRDELHRLDRILGPLMSEEDFQRLLGRARAAFGRGDPGTALAILEQVLELAAQAEQPLRVAVVLIDIGNLVVNLDPSRAIEYLARARELLEESPRGVRDGYLGSLLNLIEALARVALGETQRARELLLEVGDQERLVEDRRWAAAQLSLREGQWRAALDSAGVPPGEARGGLAAWRGHLVLASLRLLAADDPPKLTHGLLPWSLELTKVPAERRRDAALISLLPLAEGPGGDVPFIAVAEATARQLLGDPKADLRALRAEAAERADELIEGVRAQVAARRRE